MSEVIPYVRKPVESFAAEWLLDPAEIAQRIGGTDFVPTGLRNNPAAITAALLYGDELGLGRMQSLARIAVINGRPTLAAETQRALILAAGHDLWIDELTVTRCTVAGRRKDSEQISRVTWTLDDAKRAGLAGKAPWRLYPRQMLLARASAELARAVFPDVIGGLSSSEEIEDAPETAETANGPEPTGKAPATTRRRRASISAVPAPPPPPAPEPPPAPAPEPEPEPLRGVVERAATEGLIDVNPSEPAPAQTEPSSPFVIPESARAQTGSESPAEAHSGLPPEEQAIVDQLQSDFDAREVETEPEPEPEPGQLTDAQLKRMQALFRERGISDRAPRLAYARGVIGRQIDSSKDMTVAEASQVIDHLMQFDPDNPQTWPMPEDF